MSGQLSDDDDEYILAETGEDSDGSIDPELGPADYWHCLKCKNPSNNPMYSFCERCFQVGSKFALLLFPLTRRRVNKNFHIIQQEKRNMLKRVQTSFCFPSSWRHRAFGDFIFISVPLKIQLFDFFFVFCIVKLQKQQNSDFILIFTDNFWRFCWIFNYFAFICYFLSPKNIFFFLKFVKFVNFFFVC